MALKPIEHIESYTKAKRNLLFVSSLTIITAIAAKGDVSIPGFADSLTMSRGVVMTLFLLAIAFFSSEYYDQYQAASSKYLPIMVENSEVEMQRKLTDHVHNLEQIDISLREAIGSVQSSRDFVLKLPTSWQETLVEWRGYIDDQLHENRETLEKRMVQAYASVPRGLADILEVTFKNKVQYGNVESSEEIFRKALTKENLVAMTTAPSLAEFINILQNVFSTEYYLQHVARVEETLSHMEAVIIPLHDENILNISENVRKEVEMSHNLQKSIKGISQSILLSHRLSFQFRDKWLVIIVSVLAAFVCIMNMYVALRYETFWN